MNHAYWLGVARRRLPRILQRVRYASIRQLEMKISEAGPADIRPSPVHLREALEVFVGSGDIVAEHPASPAGISLPTFYSPQGFSLARTTDSERRARVLGLYEVFLRTNHEERGKTLERAVFNATIQARKGGLYASVIGSPERPPGQGLVVDAVELGEALDLVLVGCDGTRIAVEEKNLREWLSPASHEIWELIGKAVRLEALPVLICRKVTYDVFYLFKQIGALAFQMHTQLFDERFGERLAPVKHKDGLGFADIRFGAEPARRLVTFISGTLPRVLADKFARFRDHLDLLRRYAIEARLEEDLPGPARREAYAEFFRELKGWDRYEEGIEGADEDYYEEP